MNHRSTAPHLLLVMALAAAACVPPDRQSPALPRPDDREVGAEAREDGPLVDGCRLVISAVRPRVTVGDPVGVLLSIRNEGSDEYDLRSIGDPWYENRFTVLHEGKPAPTTLLGEERLRMGGDASGPLHRPLAPGEAHTLRMDLDAVYDMRRPGRYAIRASTERGNRARNAPMTLVSSWITIIVDPQ